MNLITAPRVCPVWGHVAKSVLRKSVAKSLKTDSRTIWPRRPSSGAYKTDEASENESSCNQVLIDFAMDLFKANLPVIVEQRND